MKKNKFMAFVMASMAVMAFSACGSDGDGDGDGGGGSSAGKGNAVIETDGGMKKLLTSNGQESFRYDSKGRCVAITYGYGDEYCFEWDPFKLVYDEEGESMKASLNGNGYLSKISSNYNYSEDGYTDKGSGTATFEYDGSGQLTKLTVKSSGKETDEDGTYSYKEEWTVTNTWKGGNLMKSYGKEKISSLGYSETYEETTTYTYGTTPNAYRQFVHATSDLTQSDFEELSFIGLLGKGTVQLPSKTTTREVDEDDDYTNSTTYSYTLNSDGTVQTEKVNGYSTYTYTYTVLSGDSDEPKANFAPWNGAGNSKKVSLRKIFHKKARK